MLVHVKISYECLHFVIFPGDITHWNLKEIEVPQLDNLGNTVKNKRWGSKMIKTTCESSFNWCKC